MTEKEQEEQRKRWEIHNRHTLPMSWDEFVAYEAREKAKRIVSSIISDLEEIASDRDMLRDDNDCPCCCLPIIRVEVSAGFIEDLMTIHAPHLIPKFDELCDKAAN